jgi:uncharacterized protein YbjT (DUF2867 family)
MILVTGATGNVGGELVRQLVGANQPVRALVRDPDQRGLPPSVELVEGDLNRPESLTAALADVGGVFLLPGYQDMPGVLAQMRRAGVERVVLLSGRSASDGDMSNAISRYMHLSETAVRQSGLPWTFLRPSGFMSNTFEWVRQLKAGDVLRAPFANIRVASIDPYDIAAVAALALSSEDHAGHVYMLSGPESLLPADRVRILGKVLGKDLRFEAQPNDEARAEMSRSMPVEYVDAFFKFFVDGTLDESEVLPTVEELLGRAPHSFEQWARAHADAFR